MPTGRSAVPHAGAVQPHWPPAPCSKCALGGPLSLESEVASQTNLGTQLSGQMREAAGPRG